MAVQKHKLTINDIEDISLSQKREIYSPIIPKKSIILLSKNKQPRKVLNPGVQ
jgi:hypothetical protein